MAKHPISPAQPPKRRRHVVAGQRRLGRDQVSDVTPPLARDRLDTPTRPAPVVHAPPPGRTRPAPAPVAAGTARRLPRLPRLRFSMPAGWRDIASPTIVVAVLTVFIVALATLGGIVFDKWNHDRAVAAARKDSVVAARAAMTSVLSYNYQTIDADIARAQVYLTGAFRTEYRDTAEKTVKAAAVRYKATVKAEVVYAGAITATPNTAKVLLFVNQTVNNTLIKAPRVDTPRVRLEMRKVHGKWLVSKLDSL